MPKVSKNCRDVIRRYKKTKRRQTSQKEKGFILIACFCALLLIAGLTLYEEWQQSQMPPLSADKLYVRFLDVGQGDATLIQFGEDTVLIDAGEPSEGATVVQALQHYGVTQLNHVINSHPHADHLGGIREVLAAFPAERVYMPELPDELVPTSNSFLNFLEILEKQNKTLTRPNCHDTISIGEAVMTFLTVPVTDYDDLNDCSLVCLLEYGDTSFLFCGDLTKTAELDYLDAGLLTEPITVYKCSHHGSAGSSSKDFLACIQPEYVAISVGADNDYGHPAQSCLERLTAYTDQIYRTDLDGTISVISDGRQISIETEQTLKEDTP